MRTFSAYEPSASPYANVMVAAPGGTRPVRRTRDGDAAMSPSAEAARYANSGRSILSSKRMTTRSRNVEASTLMRRSRSARLRPDDKGAPLKTSSLVRRLSGSTTTSMA
jgi:hypothetical protein